MVPQDWFRLLYQWLFSTPFFENEANVAAGAEASTNYIHRQSPGDFARQVAASHRPSTVDLSRVACPVLAVAAERDLLTPPKVVEELHREVKQVEYVTIAGSAHSVHWEKTVEVAELINGFLG